MDTTDAPAMELTRNPVDQTWGFICREHGTHRHGLTERHARNVEAKHLREDHPDLAAGLEVNLTAAACAVVDSDHPEEVMPVWMKLVGLEFDPAWAAAERLADASRDVLAYVSPL